MNMKQWSWLLVSTAAVVLLWMFVVVVMVTAQAHAQGKDTIISKDIQFSLPKECEPYYQDGTDRWKDCMGVGYK